MILNRRYNYRNSEKCAGARKWINNTGISGNRSDLDFILWLMGSCSKSSQNLMKRLKLACSGKWAADADRASGWASLVLMRPLEQASEVRKSATKLSRKALSELQEHVRPSGGTVSRPDSRRNRGGTQVY